MRHLLLLLPLAFTLMSKTHAADGVPAMLPGAFPSFTTPLPGSAAEWDRDKPKIREKLWRLLGDLPERKPPRVKIVGSEARDGCTLERIEFDNQAGDTVYGYVLVPRDRRGPGPAILYNHYHGGRYSQGKEEVLIPAFAQGGHDRIVGLELAKAGYVVLAIDAYAFGQRQYAGPAGKADQGNATEQTLFKMFAWQGRTLWGMIVRDDHLALDYLASRKDVDPQRIATMGLSMGSTRSWWVAALDERIKTAVCVVCLTRYQNLVAEGGLRHHGIYYFVPGMLHEKIDTETVVGLIAPRPVLTMCGGTDVGSPLSGVQIINKHERRLWSLYGQPDAYRGLVYDDVGHVYTPAMWQETLAWLARHL